MSQEEPRLKWSEIAKEQRYENPDVSYNAVQEQVYQIADYYANNPIQVEKNSGKTYAISDTHGDMGALLESLLRSGTVEFVDSKEPCIVVVNDYNPDHKILIPNLKLKEGCTNKLMICGDIIDRGQHTYSCMMLMKHLMNQQTQQKSNNIIFTVGNHEDMTVGGINSYLPLIDTNNDIYEGKNKDYNMAKAVILDMVEQNQMVFCHYDENTNTIYSHVPFDMENTQKALNFIQNKKSEFSEQTQQNIDEILNGLNENPDFFKDNKEGVEQLVNILNELYSYNCKYQNQELQNIYHNDDDNGLLWNRNYTENTFKAIPGINCVCGHDPKNSQDVKVNKDSSIINVDTLRSCGYTPELRQVGCSNTKNCVGLCIVKQNDRTNIDVEQLSDCVAIQYSDDLGTIQDIQGVSPVALSEDAEFQTIDIMTDVIRRHSAIEEQKRSKETFVCVSDASSDFDEVIPQRRTGNGLIRRDGHVNFFEMLENEEDLSDEIPIDIY